MWTRRCRTIDSSAAWRWSSFHKMNSCGWLALASWLFAYAFTFGAYHLWGRFKRLITFSHYPPLHKVCPKSVPE